MTRRAEGPNKLDAALAKAAGENKVVPPLEEWQRVDLEIRQTAQGIRTSFIDYARLAKRVMDEQIYLKAGFADAVDYFDDRVGIAYRTTMRYLQILGATEALPDPAEAERCLKSLAAIGVHKAAILAPAIKHDPAHWQDFIKEAQDISTEALQDTVSETLGIARKGKGATEDKAGARWLRNFLNTLPLEYQPEARAIIAHICRHMANPNPTAAVVWALDCAKRDMADAGKPVPEPAHATVTETEV